jgi:hypothetical protein
VYTLHHPWVFRVKGSLTITPDVEMLVLENTTQRDDKQDFKIVSGGVVTIAGEYVENFGTYYSQSTWLRINRPSNDTYRASKGVFYVHANASLDWRGGVVVAKAVANIAGDNNPNSPPVNISNATWNGLNSNFFSIDYFVRNYTATNFTIVGNRLYDTRDNIYTFGVKAVNSVVEGGNNQLFENYSGVTGMVTWTRYAMIRTFLNSDFGMRLPVGVFTNEKTQQGGQIRVKKSATLEVLDIFKSPISDVKITVKDYDNGDRIDYKDLPTASGTEAFQFTNQNDVTDIVGTSDTFGEFSFTKLLKEYTCRQNLTSFTVGSSGLSGTFSKGDDINVTPSNSTRKDGEFVYYDTTTNEVFYYRTRNVTLFYSSFQRMTNLSQTGTATWDGVNINQHTENAIARYTEGGDDNNPVGDVISFKYGKQITTTRLNYDGMDRLVAKVFMLDDLLITESDKTIVASYNTINTAAECYDREVLELENDFLRQTETTVTKSGFLLDARDLDVDIDATATSARSLVGNKLTLRI